MQAPPTPPFLAPYWRGTLWARLDSRAWRARWAACAVAAGGAARLLRGQRPEVRRGLAASAPVAGPPEMSELRQRLGRDADGQLDSEEKVARQAGRRCALRNARRKRLRA